MDAIAFLDKLKSHINQSVYVLFGDEDLLKRRCRDAILKLLLGDSDPAFAVSLFNNSEIDFRDVRMVLETLPFLAPVRIALVEQADDFISNHRELLEKYIASPSRVGVLILEVKTFPETTRIARMLPDQAKLACRAPKPAALPGWCVSWARNEHRKKLSTNVANLLVERVGPSLGLLASEIDKLATATGDNSEITLADVERHVRRSREADVFQIMRSIGQNKPDLALKILSEVLEDGNDPLAVLGPLTFQLRKLSAVARFLDEGQSMGMAMDSAGVTAWPEARQQMEQQLRHLGKARLAQLPDWLVELNFGLKGGNPLPNEIQLERFIVRLARS